MNARALRALVFGLGPPALIAGCTLDVTGYSFGNDIAGSGAGGSAGASASVATVGAGGGGGDGGAATVGAGGGDVADAGSDVDVPDGPTDMCGPTQSAPEKASAFPSTKPKVLDGKDDDWCCAEPIVLDNTTAEVAKGPPGGGTFTVSARVRLEWDSTAIYFFADVTNPVKEGVDATSPWKNDSVELYLRGGPTPTGDYGLYDHHYIVDHKGLVQEASPPAPAKLNPEGFLFSVKSTQGGYAVEASVSADELGGDLVAGRKLGFDLLVSDGLYQAYYLIWAIAQHGACVECSPGTCCCIDGGGPGDYPSCDTQVFGELTLLP